MTPGGRIAYVLNWVGGSTTPIDTVTGDALAPIPVGSYPVAIAMSARAGTAYVTPDGQHVVVSDGGSDQATLIDVSGGSVRHVGVGTVTPLAASSGRLASPVGVGTFSYPTGMVITGSTALVLDTYGGQVSLFSTRTRTPYAVWVRPVRTTGA